MSLFDQLSSKPDLPVAEPQFAVIIPAAGSSTRFQGFDQKKPFVNLSGRAVWLRTVEHFIGRPDVTEVVLVLAQEDIVEFKETFRPNLTFLNITITEGGATRAESVLNGIRSLTKPATYIAVHDAARPLLTRQWISEIFAAAREHSAAIPGVPVSSTVKSVDESGHITATVDRSNLVLAQTPQVFTSELLKRAYAEAQNLNEFTDEASLVEAIGQQVFLCPGWPINIKITTRQDFEMAQALLAALPKEGGLAGLI